MDQGIGAHGLRHRATITWAIVGATIHRRSWDHLLGGKRPVETGRRLKPAPQLHSLLLRAAYASLRRES